MNAEETVWKGPGVAQQVIGGPACWRQNEPFSDAVGQPLSCSLLPRMGRVGGKNALRLGFSVFRCRPPGRVSIQYPGVSSQDTESRIQNPEGVPSIQESVVPGFDSGI